jgi:hypothetical protein
MAATLLLQGMRTTSKKLLPASVPPIRKDPGEFMLKKAETLLPPERRSRSRTSPKTLPWAPCRWATA